MKLSDLHIRRHDDGTYAAVWGPFLLKSGFQPIFRMGTGPTRIGAFEALCRPIRDGVATSPGQFFPLVPSNDSYRVELQTRAVHVLNAPAVLTDREWLFLNFDPSMFTDLHSVNVALDILDETLKIADVERGRVVCEVTEHKTNESNLMLLVNQMKSRGFRIAVDDYGADSSDMERVRKLSPNFVKFDAYWITRLMDSGAAGADLLQNMVETFKERNITTLFEGIEQGWQLDLAVECGVEFVQGFVLARPQTVPSDFHAFRYKQNMQTSVPQEHRSAAVRPGSAPQMQNRPAGFHAWEHEISASMENPLPKMVLPNAERLPSQPVGQRAPQPAKVLPAAPAYVPPSTIKQGSFTPAFGTKGASFGQRR
jgi:EAL domain-containing protein (putative c-di-GMP-specific phosphodiesterase class I)